MRQNSKKRSQWPNVYKRVYASGQVGFLVDLGLLDGKRNRHSFQTKEEADTFADQKRVERLNEGTSALSLPQEVRQDAAKASLILAPHGVTLLEAATHYVKHVLAFKTAPLLGDIVKQIIADAEKHQRRDRTIAELKFRLEQFSQGFPEARLSDITVAQIEDWLDEEDWSARSRINYLTKISQLYNYALSHKWVDANLAERIKRPTAEDKEPGIFSLEQAENLLEHSHEFGLLPYISIGLFAGLRSAELMRLDWEAVKVKERSIIVGPKVAKKRSRRVVEMGEALEAWLKICQKEAGPIVSGEGFRENMEKLRAAANIGKWVNNGLRHSFGSYHLAAFGDQVKTAAQMGHRDASVIHNHYKALVLKKDAEKYWQLTPKAEIDAPGKGSAL